MTYNNHICRGRDRWYICQKHMRMLDATVYWLRYVLLSIVRDDDVSACCVLCFVRRCDTSPIWARKPVSQPLQKTACAEIFISPCLRLWLCWYMFDSFLYLYDSFLGVWHTSTVVDFVQCVQGRYKEMCCSQVCELSFIHISVPQQWSAMKTFLID